MRVGQLHTSRRLWPTYRFIRRDRYRSVKAERGLVRRLLLAGLYESVESLAADRLHLVEGRERGMVGMDMRQVDKCCPQAGIYYRRETTFWLEIICPHSCHEPIEVELCQ